MAADRLAKFKPLALEISWRMEGGQGAPPTEGSWTSPPPRPAESKELLESKLIPCERCGTLVAMLIFAPSATDAGRFEDYARKWMNVPTWAIGPALGGGPLMDRAADMLKVWPARTPIECQRPAEFNAMIDRLATGHCVNRLRH